MKGIGSWIMIKARSKEFVDVSDKGGQWKILSRKKGKTSQRCKYEVDRGSSDGKKDVKMEMEIEVDTKIKTKIKKGNEKE